MSEGRAQVRSSEDRSSAHTVEEAQNGMGRSRSAPDVAGKLEAGALNNEKKADSDGVILIDWKGPDDPESPRK